LRRFWLFYNRWWRLVDGLLLLTLLAAVVLLVTIFD
jgi:hypothetical protein